MYNNYIIKLFIDIAKLYSDINEYLIFTKTYFDNILFDNFKTEQNINYCLILIHYSIHNRIQPIFCSIFNQISFYDKNIDYFGLNNIITEMNSNKFN
jgi:hypothetical protein